jgi:hypothetical protein
MDSTNSSNERSNKWQKRRRLFEIYSKNLSAIKRHPRIHIEPDEDDVFVCPLCFRYFTRDEVLSEVAKDIPVTLEHVPPEALGGKERTLTCNSCNSWAGHELDSHLTHKLALDDFLQGIPGSSVDAEVKLNEEISLTATVQVADVRQLNIVFDQDRSDPKEMEKLNKLQKPELPIIDMSFKGSRGKPQKQRRPECSLIRIAYLWMFSVFGYGFVINDSLPYIRGQIKNPTENILPNWGISPTPEFPDQSLGINIITKPKQLQSFLVVLDLQTSLRTIRYGVMMPGPSSPGIQIYNSLQELTESGERVSIVYKPIPENRDFLEDPELCFALHDIWKQWRSM